MKFLEKVVDGHDGDLITIREVNALESGMAVAEGVDRFVGQIADSDESYAAELWKTRQLENGHVCEIDTIWHILSGREPMGVNRRPTCEVDVSNSGTAASQNPDAAIGDASGVAEMQVMDISPQSTDRFDASVCQQQAF